MKLTYTSPTYSVAVTDITPDFNDDTRLEVDFRAELSREYFDSTPFGTNIGAEEVSALFGDSTHIVYKLNVAQRHDHGLYYVIEHDRSGDYFDSYDDAVFAFGQPVIDFVDAVCELLNVSFYPTRHLVNGWLEI